jgi:DNA-binding transcriptional LysR family regulator
MQMHQIRYFLALCEERNFTRAARRSDVSQASLISGISALEEELGGPLFRRRPFVTLTTLGHAMLPYLKRIAESTDARRDAARMPTNMRVARSEIPAAHQSARRL